jgi:RNA polymerase sigma-70 factor (ECF subfamily)
MNSDQMRHELVHLGGGAHALAIQILGNADDAADAVHDSLARALENQHTYDAKKGPLKPWFLRMVRNRCIDLLRKRRQTDHRVDDLADDAASPEEIAEISDRDRVLRKALESLPSEQRQIIVLRDYVDLSYAQIAETLDIAPGTVMSRLHRARVALGKAYREQDE